MKLSRKMRKRKATLCALLGGAMMLWPCGVSHAEEKTNEYTFDQIVVTATKTARSIKDVPASVSVITAGDIKAMNAVGIDQVLIKVAGVNNARSRGAVTTPSNVSATMRGFGGASQTLIMVDGQPLNDAYSGVVQLSAIPLESVERIEVVKGPGSTLYGSQAMAGVINIITKMPAKTEVLLSSRFGGYDTWNNRFNLNAKVSEKFSFSLDYEKNSTGGFESGLVAVAPTSGSGTSGVSGYRASTSSKGTTTYIVGDTGRARFNEENIGGKLVYKFDAKRSLTVDVHHNEYTYSYGDPHNYLTYNGLPYTGNVSVGGGQRISVTEKSFWGVPGGAETFRYSTIYKDTGNGWTFNAGLYDKVRNYNISNSATNGTGRVQEKPTYRSNLDLQKELKFGRKDQAVIGIHYGKDYMQMKEYNLSNWRDYNSKTGLYSQGEGNARTLALFAQNEHKFNDRWSMTLGARWDQWTTDGMVQPNAQAASYYSDRTVAAFSPKIAFQYNTDKSSSMFLSWGKGFQAPDLYRIYSSSITSTSPYKTWNDPNPDLQPQKVTTIELGWKNKLSTKTNLNVSVFHNDVTDLIYKRSLGTVVRDGTIYYLSRYENAGEGTANGVELELSHRFNPVWSGFLNYTWQRSIITRNPGNEISEGKLVPSVPQHMLRAGIDYQHGPWHALITGNFVSKRFSNDDNSDNVNGVYGSYDPFFVANFSVDYKLDKHTTITLGIDNLFDAKYYSYYLAPERTYFAQVTYKF